jgi:phage shock protein PspC (stress-responsive transcriptional regulator)
MVSGMMSSVARRVKAFLAFLYDFVVGDDWRIAVGVVIGLAVTWGVSRTTVPAWWLLPVLLVLLLPASLWLAVRKR